MATTDKLLCCGILAGPANLALYAAQALTSLSWRTSKLRSFHRAGARTNPRVRGQR